MAILTTVFTLAIFLMMAAVPAQMAKCSTPPPSYCGGTKPVDGLWSDFKGNCYIQRMLTPNGTASPYRCALGQIIPDFASSELGLTGHTVINFTFIATGKIFEEINTWEQVNSALVPLINITNGKRVPRHTPAQVTAQRNRKFIDSIVVEYKKDFVFLQCFHDGTTIEPVSSAVLCTRTRKANPKRIKKLLKETEKLTGVPFKDMATISQENCD